MAKKLLGSGQNDGSVDKQHTNIFLRSAKTVSGLGLHKSAEEIRCVFDDNSKIIFANRHKKPMLWVLIRIA